MKVPVLAWAATIVALCAVIAADLLLSNRKPSAVTMRAAALWVAFYVALAVLFGLGLALVYDASVAGEFFAGYLTEYSLSVDNLFVFAIIMTTFAVPSPYQQRVLLFGIIAALVLRAGFIAVGAAAIERFSFTFYIFGAFLIYTAVKLVTAHGKQRDVGQNPVLKLIERFVPTTSEYHGARTVVTIDGRRTVTPLLVVMVAIATTDLLFALDSIPAIFGLTQEPYLVFTANAFALMGLRQLYFLLHGLLDRLIYLSHGLAVILGFIGIKLILEALHASGFDALPDIGLGLSLAVIVVTLAVTTIASLVMVRRDPSLAARLDKAGQR